MTREAGLCWGLSTAMASRLATRAPRRQLHLGREAQLGHQAVARWRATRNRPGRSLLTKLRGTTARRPLATDYQLQLHRLSAVVGPVTTKLTSMARNLIVGAEGCGRPPTSPRGRSVRLPAARWPDSAPARGSVRHTAAPQATWVALAAITASKVRLACRVAGFPQLVGHRSRLRGHWCQQQAAVGRLLDQVPGR